MTGHTSCNGMDCVLDGCAVCSKLVCNLLDKVLCLGNCHAVTGDDDDFFCVHKSCCVIDFNGSFFGGGFGVC